MKLINLVSKSIFKKSSSNCKYNPSWHPWLSSSHLVFYYYNKRLSAKLNGMNQQRVKKKMKNTIATSVPFEFRNRFARLSHLSWGTNNTGPLSLYPKPSCRTRARICRWLVERLAVYQESRQVERKRTKRDEERGLTEQYKKGTRNGCERGRGAERGYEEKERKKEGWWGWYELFKHVGPTPCVSFSSALGCLRTISHRMSIVPVRRIHCGTFCRT